MALRAVMAGCGQMSKGWLDAIATAPELRGRVELCGFVDIDAGAARRAAEVAGAETGAVGTDLPAMLAAVAPDILFDIVTPEARRGVVEAGFLAGCHVLSEKPMAVSLSDANAMIAAADMAGKMHAITQNRRFKPGVRRVRALIESGVLGTLTAIHSDFFIGAHFGGFREQMRNVLLVDMAIHTFDAARYIAGETPLAVYCQETNPAGSWYAHGAAANAIFEFSGGVTFTYRGSWAAEGANTSWDASWRFIGTKGTLLWDGEDGFEARVVAGEEGFLRPLVPVDLPPATGSMRTNGHASVISDFLDAVETGRPPETRSSDNIQSLAMVFAAVESARSGRRVPVIM